MYLTISIHAPARGATATCIIPYGAKDISIHAPARGATGKTLCYLIYQIFQSTLPREERPISPRMFPNAFYFNPRSRERSDCNFVNLEIKLFISIHAPARGATRFCSSCCCATDYFNPRSRERSDFYLFFNVCHSPDFNPRSRERSDTAWLSNPLCIAISIHAPARGATHASISLSSCGDYFNPRSRERSDISYPFKKYLIFHFNPRSRERSDGISLNIFALPLNISIHAPARGATISKI